MPQDLPAAQLEPFARIPPSVNSTGLSLENLTAPRRNLMPYNGFYGKLAIDEYRSKLPPRPAFVKDSPDPFPEYLTQLTNKFKADHQFARRDDISYFRALLGNHKSVVKVIRAVVPRVLSTSFNDHVYGNEAGKGWHTELQHPNVKGGKWEYKDKSALSTAKGTYTVQTVKVNGKAKAGNDGVSTFYPVTMSIDDIRNDALFVANTCHTEQKGMLIVGVGETSGIRIECLMNGTTITSAYPYEER
jgi:hypothetical protein